VGEALKRLGLAAWAQSPRLQLRLNGYDARLDSPLGDGDAVDLSLLQTSPHA
jgi:hypothetical protein